MSGQVVLPGLDAGLVSDWVGELEIGAEPPISLRRLGNGKSNLTFLLSDSQGARWVLRRPPLGELLPSAHDVRREHRVMAALERTAAPAPAPIALREPDDRCDVPLLLTEHVAGLVVDAEDAAGELEPAFRRQISVSLARTLASVHAVDLGSSGLDTLSSHKPYAGRQLRRWLRQFDESKTRELPLVTEIAERLADRVPPQPKVSLVHGDYNLSNVIVDPGDGHIRCVVDWELATLGDPLADLGGLLSYWPQSDDPTAAVPSPLTTLPGFPRREELVAAYAEASGRDVSAVGFWETLACWKVAIIGEGVLRRRLDEPENGDPAEAAQMTELMLERALLAADRAGI